MIITGGKYKGRKIQAPDDKVTRPTLSKVRQGVFNTLFSMVGDFEGKSFLDLFGGSGIMGLEALSRGFRVISFEKDKRTALAIKESYKSLKLTPELYFGDSLKNILKVNTKADVIFIDPPYKSDLKERCLEVAHLALNPDGIIILEDENKWEKELENLVMYDSRKYGRVHLAFFKGRN